MPKEHLSGSASPTERTMSWLRAQGYTVEKVEQKITRKITRDFCGFADILAFRLGDVGVLAVQATTTPHVKDRLAKILAEPRARLWVQCGHGLIIVGWALVGAGKRKAFESTVLHVFGTAWNRV